MTSLAQSLPARLSTRAVGIALAFATAVVSGVAVYVNARGVTRFDDATVYTTAKNAVAGVFLLLLALPVIGAPRRAARPTTGRQRLGLVALASSSAAACRSFSFSRGSRVRARRRRRSSTRRSSCGSRCSQCRSCASAWARRTCSPSRSSSAARRGWRAGPAPSRSVAARR